MNLQQKNWIIGTPDSDRVEQLSRASGIHPLLARILVLRGLTDPAVALSFLQAPLTDIHDPFLMKGMREAVDRIMDAMRKKENLWVFGDYDVDGVTSAALMVHFFREIDYPVHYYIPDRLSEGYGLNMPAVEALQSRGANLIITADCGIGAAREVERARDLGMEVIVTDHHQIPDALPGARAVLNPLQKDCPYPYKSLSGAGILFKLLMGLRSALREDGYPKTLPNLKRHLDLVALAAIADMVPLNGENHILARHGLVELSHTKKPGLKALKSVSEVRETTISSYDVGFRLGPRINAAGRLGKADRGVRLLTSGAMSEAMALAVELDRENRARQDIQTEVIREAREMVKRQVNLKTEYAIVLASENWHPGVIGIAASKIIDAFHRPTILIALENGMGKGSCRSIKPFNIYKGLQECASVLLNFGGHEAAAGLSIRAKDIPIFKSRFAQVTAKALTPEDLIPTLRADGEISLDELDAERVEQLETLGPFGISNPRPAFVARNVRPSGKLIRMGKNKEHVKFLLKNSQGIPMEAVGFRMAGSFSKVDLSQCAMDILFTVKMNQWRGRETLQLNLLHCRIGQDS